MKNITALDFARLYGDLVLVETLYPSDVAAKLRELADMVDSRQLVIHQAHSMESVHERLTTETVLLLCFHQQSEKGLAENAAMKEMREVLKQKMLTTDPAEQEALNKRRTELQKILYGDDPAIIHEPVPVSPRDAARQLIDTFQLNPADEEKIAEIIVQRIDDRDVGQFIRDLAELRRR